MVIEDFGGSTFGKPIELVTARPYTAHWTCDTYSNLHSWKALWCPVISRVSKWAARHLRLR
jgi:hypothetical protein